MKMKKIQYLFLAMAVVFCATSCNDEWVDEQFVQLASFKAVPNKDGVTSAYVRYNPEGVMTYHLPVLFSGSTMNSQDRTVHIALDVDTLNAFNYERYGSRRQELYYQLLDIQYYDIPKTVSVPAGESMALFPISFTLGGANSNDPLNLTDKYILPLSILDDASYDYEVNPRKYYSKALLNITPYNDYSGTYSGTQCKIYLDGQADAFTKAEHKTYVVDDKTVFVYMGLRDSEYIDRKFYKLFMEFTGEQIIPGKYKLNLWTDNKGDASNPGNNFKLLQEKDNENNNRDIQAYYTIDTEDDKLKPYLKHVYITLYMAYSFEDYTISPGNRVKYQVNGTLSMERKLNTLIPDEDQQIEWD